LFADNEALCVSILIASIFVVGLVFKTCRVFSLQEVSNNLLQALAAFFAKVISSQFRGRGGCGG
jgi:hypothetical protein